MGIQYYRDLLGDKRRLGLFRAAIFETVRPGDRVADVGTGLGTFGFFALQAGAGKVYGIDPDPVIEVAKAISRANGFEDRAVFLKGYAKDIVLPERMDLLITEDFDPLFLGPYLGALVIDSRERLLKHGGRLMPISVDVLCAPVHAPRAHRSIDLPDGRRGRLLGIDFAPLRDLSVNNLHSCALRPENLLADPGLLSSHRLASLRREDFSLDQTLTFRLSGEGVIHGLAGWFDAQLSKGVRISNGPSAPGSSWGQNFLPLQTPVQVKKGEVLELRVRTAPWGRKLIWAWEARFFGKRAGGRARAPRAEFNHSTFRGFPFSKDRYQKRTPQFAPGLSRTGKAVRFVLERADGRRSLEALGEDLCREFPDLCRNSQEGFRKVLDLTQGYLE